MARTREKLYHGKWTKTQVENKLQERYGALDAPLLMKILKIILTILPYLLPLIMADGPLNAKDKKKLAAFEHTMGINPTA